MFVFLKSSNIEGNDCRSASGLIPVGCKILFWLIYFIKSIS